jgi:hypothetical protein
MYLCLNLKLRMTCCNSSLIPSLGKVYNKPMEIYFCKKKAAALSVLVVKLSSSNLQLYIRIWYYHVQFHICDSIYSCLQKIIRHVHISGCFVKYFGEIWMYHIRFSFSLDHVWILLFWGNWNLWLFGLEYDIPPLFNFQSLDISLS